MARFARVEVVGEPHHVTQRGNGRRQVFHTDADHLVYLDLLRHHSQLAGLSILGYCLMPNHVHLVAVPRRPQALSLALRNTHGRYAAYLNARQTACGHVWQGRFYSCPLDQGHLWAALRYTECNPVRAGIVSPPQSFAWSSALAHCGGDDPHNLLDWRPWQAAWIPQTWREFLGDEPLGQAEDEDVAAIRGCTHSGRPLGAPAWVLRLERELGRRLAPLPGGRPPKERHAAA